MNDEFLEKELDRVLGKDGWDPNSVTVCPPPPSPMNFLNTT